MKTRGIIIALLVILIVGCKEEFLLKFDTDEKILVVEGDITNFEGPYSVRLSTTLPVNQPLRVPLENCTVTISDNTGQHEVLSETEPGVYETLKGGIQGIVGNEYSLSVVTPEGKRYETDFEKMEEPVEIDSVFAELTYKESLDYPFGLPGYQFYVNTKPGEKEDNYFLWKLTESFQYDADYRLYALYYYGDLFYISSDKDQVEDIVKLDYDTLFTCWQTETVKDIFTGQTANLSSPQINRQPLHFVATDTKKLSVRYSLLVQQYAISKKTYQFWKSIREQIADESFLNTKQPYNIAGNLRNVEEPEEITYGFFTVASIAEERVFYYRPNATFYFETGYTAEPIDLHKKQQPVYLILKDNAMYFVHKDCVDCRTEEGEPQKPNFWID
ncbi:MAG: DUF4249 domain-containing protein [Draconibacterium sp.]